jgi:hypothetical protein
MQWGISQGLGSMYFRLILMIIGKKLVGHHV